MSAKIVDLFAYRVTRKQMTPKEKNEMAARIIAENSEWVNNEIASAMRRKQIFTASSDWIKPSEPMVIIEIIGSGGSNLEKEEQ